MRIANPIYDVVIKFLLEDNAIAKEFLSVLLEVPIVALELRPQERTIHKDGGLSLMRFDFKALVKTKTKKLKKVLIEFQKSKSGLQIVRFRQYLGMNYIEFDDIPSAKGINKKGALPISTIYFLGFEVAGIDTPILQVVKTYIDKVSGKEIKPHKYVEHLTHDFLMIQIPRLNMTAQTAMEKVLDVFNEAKYKTDDPHILDYTGDSTDPLINRMLDRLNLAIANPEILHALLNEKREEEEEAMREAKMRKKDKKLEEKDKKLEEKDKKLEEKDKIIGEERLAKEAAEYKVEMERHARENAEHKAEIERHAREKAEAELEALKKQLAEAMKKDNKDG
jgi:hypothetical protein